MTTRRAFLLSLASASVLTVLEVTGRTALSHPVLAAVGKAETGAFSGDRFFAQMHTELLGRKRDAKGRSYPARPDDGKIDILVVGGGVAGLDVAWYLLNHPIVKKSGAVVRLFEMDDELGGTAKEYAWEGIPYSNSAAYFYVTGPAHPDMQLYREIGVLDEVLLPTSRDKESICVGTRILPDLFQAGRGHAAETAGMRAQVAYYRTLLEEAYPEVPFKPGGDYSQEEFKRLDRLSLGAFLEQSGHVTARGRTLRVPPAPAIFREFVETYCYSSFGCSAHETSAWQGLNWFCAEFEEKGVGVLPGANGRITTKLKEKIDRLDPACLRCSMPVVDIRHDARTRTNEVVVALREGTATSGYRSFRARIVIMCSPVFISRRILAQELSDPLRRAVDTFRYSAYIVANAFIRANVLAEYWDLYCLDDLADPGPGSARAYRNRPFMDVINATWALRRRGQAPPDRTVLTLYTPQPFEEQRRNLLRPEYCEGVKGRIREDLVRRFGGHGLKADGIHDIRLARWGHAMLQATPGMLASGVLEQIAGALSHRGILFAGTEMMGAPTIENCHLTARAAVERAVRILGGSRREAVR